MGVPPNWKPKLWVGDAKVQGLSRAQTGEKMHYDDAAFDSMFCMSSEDLSKFHEVFVLGCEKWR